MAHYIDAKLDRLGATTDPMPCNDRCKFWRFPNSERPCVLSNVFSVVRGQPCYKFVDKDEREMVEGSG